MSAVKKKQKESEPVVVDTVTERTERIEVIEEITPESKPQTDPLNDFKEKMIEEERTLPDNPQRRNYMWPILFVFIIAIASLAGVFFYKNAGSKSEKAENVNVVSLSSAPTVAPEPTKTVDLTAYEIKILNGSEAAGEAGRQKDNLEGEGFIVDSVGNADKSDYEETIIQAKENVDKAFLDKLKSFLAESFAVGQTEELSSDSDSDIIVILGSETN